jgi:DNA-directed RNA polymerase subunit RPC12/RpoP
LPEPTRPRRWSERRIKATLGNAIVGFVLGVLAAPVWGMLSFLVLAMLGALLGFGPLHSDDIIYATPIAMLIGWFALSVGARGTCSKSPVAPLGVAIGLGAGTFVAASPWLGSFVLGVIPLHEGLLVGAFMLVGSVQVVAAYRGGLKGLAARFGKPQVGVGVLCATCGYDLEQTPAHWPCPECGSTLRYPTKTPDPDGVDPEPAPKRAADGAGSGG